MDPLRDLLRRQLTTRNDVSRRFFDGEADRLASACQEMARRFSRGGRLFAFGTGSGVTDAQHVAVEFVHPVIVGKRALPAVDISTRYCQWSVALVKPDDIVMGFDPTDSHPGVARAIAAANGRGAQTFGLCSRAAGYAIGPIDDDPFIHQEIVEVLYHVLWETVHVFLEHTPIGHDVGAAGFLYPFLGSAPHDAIGLIPHVASSIKSKARDDERLRDAVADQAGETIVSAVRAIHQRITAGGTLLLLGNGGSATDATDWALDCIDSPKGYPPVAALLSRSGRAHDECYRERRRAGIDICSTADRARAAERRRHSDDHQRWLGEYRRRVDRSSPAEPPYDRTGRV